MLFSSFFTRAVLVHGAGWLKDVVQAAEITASAAVALRCAKCRVYSRLFHEVSFAAHRDSAAPL